MLCVDCVNQARKQARPVRSRLGFTGAGKPPYVTYGLIVANIAAYIYGTFLLGTNQWILDWGLFPGVTEGLFSLGTDPYRWITSGFLHFGLWHIGLNMFVLWQFGTQLEPAMGRWRFAGVYLVGLLGSSAAVVLLGGAGSVHGGASGAIFGVIAAYAIALYKLRLPWQSVAVSAGLWLVLGFVVGGVSWQGHLGGVIGGAIAMLAMLHWVDRKSPAKKQSAGW